MSPLGAEGDIRLVPHSGSSTDTYLNATTQLLHELNERKPLALVKG